MSICDEAMSKATNKGYLITAEGCTPVDIPKEDGLQTMYKLIGCSMVQSFDWELSNGKTVSLYLDEEGLFSSGIKLGCILHGADSPVVGNIIVLGTPDYSDGEGYDTSAPEDFEEHKLIARKGLLDICA
ncbi:DUF3846 domain-containing protein [Vibrio vulnificus]|uniref:DUF3846 domain-containing protein n=1 Tax=Vibrio vulnificus TaxID=672 RepID=UPI001CDC50B7|nr:hypothetical protein [Vibrio vulnificus]MCA4005048.1 hypothetical protein [Vibrio vulnificus]